ncbi:NAD(P)/FAD-dependent oxidoreductase [Sediminibacterium ginsengisoli]|uniref:Protoporphyrinogen oxidase n=1 Tax=Sediminibacterium ginsengisoli TaxID=413434 RepID=A0A1T4PYV4_9BACT|nr:NAD(P)/FAD-dependent oxidoreductase [Sediminibacterium ginsengisoli]SJZ96703.1 Protoporphyrinogen oxidase [Sediminibacterium ginsengisoli]
MKKKVAIIGAGPAGLTAAYLLGKEAQDVTVFEKDPQYVGGISRTESYKGYHFDIGGHRFFSKSKEVEDFWTEILGDEMLERPRSSRIYYNKKFFSYPLVAFEALSKLGVIESALCVLSYLRAKLFPVKNPTNFEDWVTNQFGKRLFNIFFKTYTEKVWGIPCKEISADWAAQRIKGLSLSSAIWNALFPKKKSAGGDKGKVIKTLIDSFRYPKYGPGMMWEVCAEKSKKMGVQIEMNCGVKDITLADGKWTVLTTDGRSWPGYDYVLSSAPMRELVQSVIPPFPQAAQQSAKALGYRDFLTVVLICKDEDAFSDNWIYIHDPSVKVGRIQNFKSWSPYMVPDSAMACYGLEYFCFEGDGLWTSSDADLIALATREITQIGLTLPAAVVDGYVVRQPKAYPVYDQEYKHNVDEIRNALKEYPGLYLVGRNGMHKYNNQDHSMMTAMLAAKNIVAGEELYDLWDVNEDAEYHEGGNRGAEETGKVSERLVPVRNQ